MTKSITPLLAVVFSLALPVVGQSATTLTEAEITKIVRDVKTIDPAKGSHPAALKETVRGQQSVRTGLESRTELLFNDHTITRLGANTHFSFSEGTRNMSLDNGAILLQVPKGIGGAKIETAAATAGITGTTILLEAARNYTKLIVLEGECCLSPKSPNAKSRHKICASAGEELIVILGSNRAPDRLNVNLRIIENTSLLLTGKWGVTLNTGPLIAAANGQGSTYVSTNSGASSVGAESITTLTKLPQTGPTTSNPPPTTTTTTTTVTTPRTPPSAPPPGNIR